MYKLEGILRKDYLDYEYNGSLKRRHMSLSERAAQFAPFAALTGYDDAIKEEKRETDGKIYLLEDEKEEINIKLISLIKSKGEAEFEYFIADEKKEGGCYKKAKGKILKAIEDKKIIILDSGLKIRVEDIVKVLEKRQ